MAYDVVGQQDVDSTASGSPSPFNSPKHLASPVFAPPLSMSRGLFLDNPTANTASSSGLSHALESVASRSTKTGGRYDLVESNDLADDAQHSPVLSTGQHSSTDKPLFVPQPRPLGVQATASRENEDLTVQSRAFQSPPEPILRTASGRRNIALRHPTPDLQTLQGAYTGNILHLEETAERLSMTSSSIEDAIRDLHTEQKRSESRRSSMLSALKEMPQVSRQLSNPSSIIDVNSAARSGGYSPAGFTMSPKGSFSTGGSRAASKSSKFGSRPEPELEGRPLDSFVSTSFPTKSPILSRTASIAEHDEGSKTMTQPALENLESRNGDQMLEPNLEERPVTSASTNDLNEAQEAFAEFDGIHSAPPHKVVFENDFNDSQRMISSETRPSMARPQSYADPETGQQMVYYPAPVPMILTLPQKLSKTPSSMARNKRRSQVLSNIPQEARQSAIWLPDVLEDNGPDKDPKIQDQEYVPQHQRVNMGGRRSTQDVQHLPPQLRANMFAQQPSSSQVVELKEQSAVATLDSILDASASAPVGAFTDHAFAGRLGAEVYGKASKSKVRKTTPLPSKEQPKKRRHSFGLLRGRRPSNTNLLESTDENKQPAAPDVLGTRKGAKSLAVDDVDEAYNRQTAHLEISEAGGIRPPINGQLDYEDAVEDQAEDEDQSDDELYQGPPTTLLAELQLRKQQQKQRTRPIASAYPNGIHSTLLELDAVAQVEQKSRKQKRVNLAWEEPHSTELGMEDDEDVPLGVLYANEPLQNQPIPNQERIRPLGLMERRELEENEPLSKRRDRLQGRRPEMKRASTMQNLSGDVSDEEETLAQRIQRLKGEGRAVTGLPTPRPVSGAFTSELMSQFGDLDAAKSDTKGKGKEATATLPTEEEETLGQRRKRLQAEREAQAQASGTPDEAQEQPAIQKRRSMADILHAHPAAGANRSSFYGNSKPVASLLDLHEQQSMQRASTMLNLDTSRVPPYVPRQSYNQNEKLMFGQQPLFAQPSMNFGLYNSQMMMPFANPYAMGYPTGGLQMGYMPGMQGKPMATMLQMGRGVQPLNQGQIDMVERWRQSVMQ